MGYVYFNFAMNSIRKYEKYISIFSGTLCLLSRRQTSDRQRGRVTCAKDGALENRQFWVLTDTLGSLGGYSAHRNSVTLLENGNTVTGNWLPHSLIPMNSRIQESAPLFYTGWLCWLPTWVGLTQVLRRVDLDFDVPPILPNYPASSAKLPSAWAQSDRQRNFQIQVNQPR